MFVLKAVLDDAKRRIFRGLAIGAGIYHDEVCGVDIVGGGETVLEEVLVYPMINHQIRSAAGIGDQEKGLHDPLD